jgi:hypothetical protein
VNENYGFDQGRPPTPSRCFQLESSLNFIFDFEFEYRKHHTIKGVRIDSQEMLIVL